MYGAILGDIVGSPYEHDSGMKTKNFPLICEESRFTDDTVMSIAVAEALMNSAGKNETEYKAALIESMQKWGKKYPYVGYGRRFISWLNESNPLPYNSWGNGSAMRVSAVGWLYDTLEETLEKAKWTSEVTHNHPEGIRGAQTVAAAIYMARTNRTMDEIRSCIANRFFYDLNRTCDEIRPKYHFDVSCQGSVPEAIIAFLESTDLIDAIRNAVSLGGDADTLASIAGGIAEAFWGIDPMTQARISTKLTDDILEVLDRFSEYRNQSVKKWIRKVAAGEDDGGDKLTLESAKNMVDHWDKVQEVLLALKKGYETGDFSDVEQYLTNESIFESQWVLEHLTGKKEIMRYLNGKGATLKRNNSLASARIPRGCEGDYMYVTQGDNEMGIEIQLDIDGLVARIDLVMP